MQTVHAIYQSGTLNLLDDVELTDGQTVEVQILSKREQVKRALEDLTSFERNDTDHLTKHEADKLVAKIRKGLEGVTLSDIIIEERRSQR